MLCVLFVFVIVSLLPTVMRLEMHKSISELQQ